MTGGPSPAVIPRRDFLKAGGALMIGFSVAAQAQRSSWIAFSSGPDQPDPEALDTWIAIQSDNTATIYLGFVELGQGCSTATT